MSDNERNSDKRTGEDQHERLYRELLELLQELWLAIPGVQVLFAFLLTVPFSQGFSSVTTLQEIVYFATMLCTAGLTFLALAMLCAVFLISDVVFGGVVAIVATVGIGSLFAWFWYAQPLHVRE